MRRLGKVSPPFEGGGALRICPVGKFSEEPGHREGAGTIDYLVFTRFISRPGWLMYSLFVTFISMRNKNFFNRKGIKSFRSFLRKKATSLRLYYGIF